MSRGGWTVLGSNSGGGEISLTRTDRPWGPTSFLYKGYRVFPGVKRTGCGINHSSPSSVEVKEIVELYLYSLSGSPLAVIGGNLPLPLSSVMILLSDTRKYRVIHKSLRDFRTRLRNNQDSPGRKEHINR